MFIQNLNLRKKLGMGKLLEADVGAGTNGADNGTGGEDSSGTGEGTGEGEGTEGDSKSFDDILKGDKKYQSEFDKKIAKALETAKGKWETEYNTKLEDVKTEAEKLAKMNADEKAKYAEQKRAADLEKREKDITTRELKAQAYETLAEKALPKELIDILNYENADTCNKSIESVEKAFQSAVEKAVNEKLRGGNPPKGGQGADNSAFSFNFTGVRPKSK
jgi:transketolase